MCLSLNTNSLSSLHFISIFFSHFKPITMHITSQNLITAPISKLPNHSFHFTNTYINNSLSSSFKTKPPNSLSSLKSKTLTLKLQTLIRLKPIRAFESPLGNDRPSDRSFDIDALLSVVETICIVPSVLISVACVVKKSVLVSLRERVVLWNVVLLVGAVVLGCVIRRRQWRRICRETPRRSVTGGGGGGMSCNVFDRIQKLEEDLRGTVGVIRGMSRQLEKLGIRFRVTRRTLMEPITETAALAQKNSEATRVLAMQEDLLEKELGEIQMVLLAMQEQQQKQFELILAIGNSGGLREILQEPSEEENLRMQLNSTPDTRGAKPKENQVHTQAEQ